MSTKFQRVQAHTAYQLRIELQCIEPLIWRRILVPETLKLSKLDRIVQAAMGWTNSHLHDWRIGSQRYGVPDAEWIGSSAMLDERKFTIGKVLGEQVKTFAYSYDFGDGWDHRITGSPDHRITVEDRLPVQEGRNDWPMCLAGENAVSVRSSHP